MPVQAIIIIFLTSICAYTDWRYGKIYNKFTYPAAGVGLALSFILKNPRPLESVVGLVGAFLLFALMRKLCGMGAGDVKLMVAIGAIKGLPFVIFSSFYILCFAGLGGILIIAWKGRLIPVIKWLGNMFASVLFPSLRESTRLVQMTSIPFAPFILLGTLFALYLEYIGGPFTLTL